MHNPFAEENHGDVTDKELAEQAQGGNRAALEALVLRHQAWIYNIAVRMVFEPHDAEEVTQEVLVKVITKLSQFKGESDFRTWLYRIVTNHVLNMRRRSLEKPELTFAFYGAEINRVLDQDLPDPKTIPVEVPLMIEESKISCTMGMLLCLDRKQRLIFTLGEILSVSDRIGAEVLEMTAGNFRQSLSRARKDLSHFMTNQCGLVNQANPCRCAKKTKGFIEHGHVDPQRLRFASRHFEHVRDVAPSTTQTLENTLEREHAKLYRDHPFLQPVDQITWLRNMLQSDSIRSILRLSDY